MAITLILSVGVLHPKLPAIGAITPTAAPILPNKRIPIG